VFSPQGVCRCSGYSNGGPLLPNVEMVDTVRIPAHLPPGKYVLQWRWDVRSIFALRRRTVCALDRIVTLVLIGPSGVGSSCLPTERECAVLLWSGRRVIRSGRAAVTSQSLRTNMTGQYLSRARGDFWR